MKEATELIKTSVTIMHMPCLVKLELLFLRTYIQKFKHDNYVDHITYNRSSGTGKEQSQFFEFQTCTLENQISGQILLFH